MSPSVIGELKQNVLTQGYLKSELAEIFVNYYKSSCKFTTNVIAKRFSFWIWHKPKISEETLAIMGVNQEHDLRIALNHLIKEEKIYKNELNHLLIELEAFEEKLSYRANYLIGGLSIIALLSSLLTSLVENIGFNSIDSKVLLSSIFAFISLPFISESWKMKRLSGIIKSFTKVAKSVFDDPVEQNNQIPESSDLKTSKKRRKSGSAKGLIYIAPDFNESFEDFYESK